MKRNRNCWYLVCEYNWKVLWHRGEGWAREDFSRHNWATHKTCWTLKQALRNAEKIESLGGKAEILRRCYRKGTLCHQFLYLQ